jgi:hypothetical protein
MNGPHLRPALQTALIAGTVVAAWLVLHTGCSKSSKDGQDSVPTTNLAKPPFAAQATQVNPATTVSPALSNNPAVSSPTNTPVAPDGTSAPAQQVAALKGQFGKATTFDDRFDLALQIGAVGTAEAVATLEQLFREERDKDLRVELINALMGMTGCKDERLRFLQAGLLPDQPLEVREAAMDGLVDLQDARALPLLAGLLNDPNPKIQALARHLHDLAEKIVKPQ